MNNLPKEDTLDVSALINKLNERGLNDAANSLNMKRAEIDSMLSKMNPYTEQETIDMISNYAIILDDLNTKDQKTNKEAYQQLLAATYSVGFAIGQGVDIAKVLPIMAIAGAQSDMGIKILSHYLKEKKKNTK